MLAAIVADWPEFVRVDIDEVRSANLAVRRRLRGFDAVQLAAALTLSDELGPDSLAFTSFDGALSKVAGEEGVLVLET